MEAITPNAEDIIGALKTLIRAIGEDPDREGLIGTPDRIMRMWKEIFAAISAIRSTSPTKTSPKRRSCVKSPIFRPTTS